MVLTGLVTNQELWGLLKRIFRAEVDKFWLALKFTDVSDNKRVEANHKLAVAAETFVNDIEKAIEQVHYQATHPLPQVIDDVTKNITGVGQ